MKIGATHSEVPSHAQGKNLREGAHTDSKLNRFGQHVTHCGPTLTPVDSPHPSHSRNPASCVPLRSRLKTAYCLPYRSLYAVRPSRTSQPPCSSPHAERARMVSSALQQVKVLRTRVKTMRPSTPSRKERCASLDFQSLIHVLHRSSA